MFNKYPQSLNSRSLNYYHLDLKVVLKQFFKDYPQIRLTKYIGSNQNIVDFLLIDGTLKSNKVNSKVCPAIIGQLSKKRFFEEFGLPQNTDIKDLKVFIFQNIFQLTFKYYQNLFVSDFIGSINKKINFIIHLLIEKMFIHIHFIKKNIFLLLIQLKNESVTLKYKNLSGISNT